MNKISYTKLQLEQWSYYYHLAMTEGIWVGQVTTTMATINSMCQTYGRSKIIIEQRQKKYQKQLEQIQNDINEYLKQAPTLIEINKIIQLLNHLIHQDQTSFRLELERRKDMLRFNAKEHQYVHAFYNLKPRPAEVSTKTYYSFDILFSLPHTYIFRFIQRKSSGKLFMMNNYYYMKLLFSKNGSLGDHYN